MPSQEEKNRDLTSYPQENLESPFLDEEIFVKEDEADAESHLEALQSESSFRYAFEEGRTGSIEPEDVEEEFDEEEEWAHEEDLTADETEAQDEEALSEESMEGPYDEETLDEEGEGQEEVFEATALDEESAISDEDWTEAQEEESDYPLEEAEYADEEAEYDDESLIDADEEEVDWASLESEKATGIPAGRDEVAKLHLLKSHRGSGPDLILSWNDMAGQPQSVDVVVHLHGYSLRAGKLLNISRDIVPRSGLDWSDPEKVDRTPGRSRPTLTLLPRGHFFGGKSGRGYSFPALVTKAGLKQLVDFGLGHFARHIGATNVALRRLIVTAHSGGGAALLRILRHNDLHEVQVFDGLYQDPAELIRWVKARIERDSKALEGGVETPERYMPERGGALRVLFRPGSATERYSLTVDNVLPVAIPSGSPLHRWYRVEQTSLGHLMIPRRYGWRLLANDAADLPGASAPRQARTKELQFDEDVPSNSRLSTIVGSDQRGWILALDRSAIELLPDTEQRKRFLNQVNWSRVEFPGNGRKSPEVEANWRLADQLFNAMAVVAPERRVPRLIRFHAPVVVNVPGQSNHKLFAEACDAFMRMREAAAVDGVRLVITSSWRSAKKQASLHRGQPNLKAVARKSAHMYGLAIDLRMSVPGLNVPASTRSAEKMARLVRMYRLPVYKWMALRGREFGWYPYRREPWHWEYNPPGLKERFEAAGSRVEKGEERLEPLHAKEGSVYADEEPSPFEARENKERKLDQQLEELQRPVMSFQQEPFEFDIIPIDGDTRKHVRDTTPAPFRWICSIELFTKNPKYGGYNEQWLRQGKATGVLIAPSYVLTAAHVFWVTVNGKQQPIERVVITPGRNQEKAPFGSTEARSNDWRTPKKWDPDPKKLKRKWDFAAIRVKEALGNKTFKALQGKPLGWWGSAEHGLGSSMKPLDPTELLKSTVWSAGYPGDSCGTSILRSEEQIAQCQYRTPQIWATTQWSAGGTVVNIDHQHAPGVLWHTIDKTKGESGSPIWYYKKQESGKPRLWLVGVHVGPGGFTADERGKSIPASNRAVWIRPEVLQTIRDMVARLKAGRP